jgi:hypothetical protein
LQQVGLAQKLRFYLLIESFFLGVFAGIILLTLLPLPVGLVQLRPRASLLLFECLDRAKVNGVKGVVLSNLLRMK